MPEREREIPFAIRTLHILKDFIKNVRRAGGSEREKKEREKRAIEELKRNLGQSEQADKRNSTDETQETLAEDAAKILAAVKEGHLDDMPDLHQTVLKALWSEKLPQSVVRDLAPIIHKIASSTLSSSADAQTQAREVKRILDEHFAGIRQDHPQAAKYLGDKLIDMNDDLHLTKDEVKDKYKVTSAEAVGAEESDEDNTDESNDGMSEAEKLAFERGRADALTRTKLPDAERQAMTSKEREAYDRGRIEAVAKAEQRGVSSHALDPQDEQRLDALMQKLNLKDRDENEVERLYRLLEKGKASDLAEALGEGWREEEVHELIDLEHKRKAYLMSSFGVQTKELERYGYRAEDIGVFNADYMIKNWDTYFTGGKLNRKGKKLFIRKGYNLMNQLLRRVSANPDTEWRDNWDPIHEGRVERDIRNIVLNLSDSDEIRDKLRAEYGDHEGDKRFQEFQTFFTKTVVKEMRDEVEMRQAYHMANYFITRGHGTPEDMAKFNKKYPASKLNLMLQGYHGRIIELVLSEFERDLHSRVVRAGNNLPLEFFTSYFDPDPEIRYENTDRKRIRDNLETRIRQLQKDPTSKERMSDELVLDLEDLEDWEIDRALTIAPGMSLLNTLRAHEIIAMANPKETYEGQPQFAQYFNMRHKWTKGRGGEGIFDLPELFNIEIEMGELDDSLVKRITGWIADTVKGENGSKRWIPKVLYDKVQKAHEYTVEYLMEEFRDVSIQAIDDNGKNNYRELLREFSIFGFISRGGWRLDPLKKWFKDRFGHSVDEGDWNESYDKITREVGASARWFFDNARATSEVKHFVLSQKLGTDYKERYTPDELKIVFQNYLHGKSDRDTFTVQTADGGTVALDAEQLIKENEMIYKGMNFKALLERSPYDFLLNLVQLEPKLTETFTTSRGELSAWDYFFNQSIGSFNLSEQKQIRQFQDSIKKRWGPNNYDVFGKVTKFYHTVYQDYKGDDGKYNVESAQDDIYAVMTLATEKVKLEQEDDPYNPGKKIGRNKMTREDMMWTTDDTPEDHKRKKLSGILQNEIFGGDGKVGFIQFMDGRGETFGEDRADMLGSKGFFYAMAKRWFGHDQRGAMPNTNEMRLIPLLSNITNSEGGGIGEDVYVRLWNDVHAWNEAVNKMVGLDDMLKRVAVSHDMKEIYEVHQAIQHLEGMIGEEGAQRLNYILANVVVRFYHEDYRARFPAPLNLLTGTNLGREISLSKLRMGHQAMSMKEEDIQEYAYHLFNIDALSEHGEWSMHRLERALEADKKKYYTLQLGPTVTVLVAGGILLYWLQKAMEEEGPKEAESK